jgi:hypothetical protein
MFFSVAYLPTFTPVSKMSFTVISNNEPFYRAVEGYAAYSLINSLSYSLIAIKLSLLPCNDFFNDRTREEEVFFVKVAPRSLISVR